MAKGTPVSTIHIALEASASKLAQGLKGALGRIGDFSRRSASMLSNIVPTGVLQGIGQAFGQRLVSQISGLIGPQLEAIDGLAKMADLAGLTTEQLQAYRHAAGLAGLSSDLLDRSVKKLNVNLALAQRGLGPAQGALQMLGITAEQIAAAPTDQKLKLIAEALESVEGTAQRAALASQLFGEEGQSMAQFLRGGSQALADMEAHAESLGIALDRVDAAKVEAANDAVANMSAMWDGFMQQITVAIAPTITALADMMTEAGKEGEGAATATARAFSYVERVVAGVLDIINRIRAEFASTQAEIAKGLASLARDLDAFDKFTGDRIFGGAAAIFAEEFDRVATRKFAESAELLERALTREAGDGFLAKIDEARVAAEKVAETAADRLESVDIAAAEAIAAAEKETRRSADRSIDNAAALRGTTEGVSAVISAQQAMQRAAEALAEKPVDDPSAKVVENTAELIGIEQQNQRILNRIERTLSGGLIAEASL